MSMTYKGNSWRNSRRQSRDDHYWDYANNWELEELLAYLKDSGISVKRAGDRCQLIHGHGLVIPKDRMQAIKNHKTALMIMNEFEGTTVE